MLACINGNKDVVKLLLNHPNSNIELNTRGFSGETALMFACREGHKDIVEILLEHPNRFDLNAKDRYGSTALKYAELTEARFDAEFRMYSVQRPRGYKEIVQLIKSKLNPKKILKKKKLKYYIF